MASKYFKKALSRVKPENRRFVQKNLDIVEQVHAHLSEQKLTQKDLSDKLGKTEAEVSRMLSGTHNLTLKTITKIEVALDRDIVVTPRSRNWVVRKIAPIQVTIDKKPLDSKNILNLNDLGNKKAVLEAYSKDSPNVVPMQLGSIYPFAKNKAGNS